MICLCNQMKGHMAAYCRRPHLPHDLKKPQEVSNSPQEVLPSLRSQEVKDGQEKAGRA